MLYSEALLQLLPDRLRQAACGSVPLAGSSKGLFVQLHDLGHLIVHACVQETPPGREGVAQQAKVLQGSLHICHERCFDVSLRIRSQVGRARHTYELRNKTGHEY